MTKPKKKLSSFIKCVALVVLLAVIVPAGYMYLSGNGALESFRQVFAGTEETLIVDDEYVDSALPGEAIRVGGVMLNIAAEADEKDSADESADNAENTAAAENADENADEITTDERTEKPSQIARLIELIFGRENKVEVYE